MNLLASLQRWRERRANRARERRETLQWFLLTGRRDLGELTDPRPAALQPLYPPHDRFWADPFLWGREGRTYLFFEDYPYATGRGHISVLELDGEGLPLGESRPVLQPPWHLSYPYLFEYEGQLYMVPEQKAQRNVELYRCTEFPDHWERIATWFPGTRMVDCSIFEHDGRWWLFSSIKGRGYRYDETLFAFYADNPISGAWTPHPLNPLVRDYAKARSGGRILRDDQGRLLRPSQNCQRRYGDGLNISGITLLTTEHYAEQRLWHSTGAMAGGWRGLHHLDWHQGLIVMDALRVRPDP